MEITGKIVNVLPTLSGQGKNGEWVKNSFVIEWQDNGYKQLLCLEVVGADKFEKMKNAVKVGHEVLCKFNVTSREYQGRWYTSCSCFYCSNVGGQQQQQQQAVPNAQPAPQTGIPQDGTHVDDNGLPF
jgi:hypothetical protein